MCRGRQGDCRLRDGTSPSGHRAGISGLSVNFFPSCPWPPRPLFRAPLCPLSPGLGPQAFYRKLSEAKKGKSNRASSETQHTPGSGCQPWGPSAEGGAAWGPRFGHRHQRNALGQAGSTSLPATTKPIRTNVRCLEVPPQAKVWAAATAHKQAGPWGWGPGPPSSPG